MKKTELIAKMLEKNNNFSIETLSKAVNIMFEQIKAHLTEGKRVEIRGFGAFSVLAKPARIGRNPRTGEPVNIKAKNVIHFKSGKELKELVN